MSSTPAPGGLPGLDAVHSTLVRTLTRSSTWSRADFEREAGACGLLPDGALETVNEWAYDTYGEPLIEDGDPVTVNLDLLPPRGDRRCRLTPPDVPGQPHERGARNHANSRPRA